MSKEAVSFHAEFQRALRAVLENSLRIRKRKRQARRTCDALLSYSEEKQEALLRDGRATRIRSRPTAEELIRRIRQQTFRDPKLAEDFGRVAERLIFWMPRTKDACGGERGWHDLRARLSAHRGNVARIRCAWEEAHDHFAEAHQSMEDGTGDLLLRAEVLRLHASLYKDRRHHEEALFCLAQAEALYRETGELSFLARTLMKRATVYRALGRHAEGVQVHFEACKLFDSFEEPELGVVAWNNLAVQLCDLGRFEEARRVLAENEQLLRLCDRRSTVHVVHVWVSGMVRYRLGQVAEAEALYLRARRGYDNLEDPYNQALVSLDLATLYSEQNRLDDLAAIAEETYETLRSQQLDAEAEQAVRLFVEAARRRQVAQDLIRSAAHQLGRRRSCWQVPL